MLAGMSLVILFSVAVTKTILLQGENTQRMLLV